MSDQKVVALPAQLIAVPEGVVVKRGVEEMLVAGEYAVEALGRLLAEAGSTPAGISVEEMCATLKADLPDLDVADLIERLRAKRILVDSAAGASYPETPDEVLAWNMGGSPATAAAGLSRVSLNLLGVNAVSRRLAESLISVGANVRVIDHPEFRNVRIGADGGVPPSGAWGTVEPVAFEGWEDALPGGLEVCLVACSDFGGLRLLADWNALAYQNGWSFLPVVLQNLVGLVGPFVIPGETACFQCLLAREDANSLPLASRRAAEYHAFQGQSIAAYHPSMASALGDVAAVELTKHYAYGLTSAAIGNAIEMNLMAASMRRRPILKVPGCPVCSSLNVRGVLQLLRAFSSVPTQAE